MQNLVLFLQLSIYTSNSRQVSLKRSTESRGEAESSKKITGSPKTVSMKPISWHFYFGLSIVNLSNITNKKENANFVVLSIHEVQNDNAEVVSSKVFVFRERVLWNDFSEEIGYFPGKNPHNSRSSIIGFLGIDTGFKNTKLLPGRSFKFRKNNLVYFYTEKFVVWLRSKKERLHLEHCAMKWRFWRKDRSVSFSIHLDTQTHYLRASFIVVNYHGVFLIKDILCLKYGYKSGFSLETTDKLFVRVNEDNFKKLCHLIESFE